MTPEGKLLWSPSDAFASAAPLTKYIEWLNEDQGHTFSNYAEVWSWSTDNLSDFWESIWNYFGVSSPTPFDQVLDTESMPGCTWFQGARVNYAEHILRAGFGRENEAAIHFLSEREPLRQLSWADLGKRVRRLAESLRALGVVPGDRIVSYMPNTPETVIAFLATAAIGAVWASSAPEFGVKTVTDRFAQIEPKIIFVCDGYVFNGKEISRREEALSLVAALPTIKHVILAPVLDKCSGLDTIPNSFPWESLVAGPEIKEEDFCFEPVLHNHPLWILFSSGTTGLPKAIVQSHVGIVVEHYKLTCLHMGLTPGKVMFFYSTAGWMMWNVVVSSLLSGASIVLYDGSPVWPDPSRLWQIAQDARVTYFGASASFLQIMRRSKLVPREKFNLRIEATLTGGSPVAPELFEWFYENVESDCWFSSQSGGTETCTCLLTAVPSLPVYAGELQARGLGIALDVWNELGEPLLNEVGELVLTKPFPSMPIFFWNDPTGDRYREAYFDTFPGVWRHGDLIKINDRGGCYIYGRSDATLNRHGVRIGSAEVYQALEKIDGIADSLIVCAELPGGEFFMPLFVVLKPHVLLDDRLAAQIAIQLRQDGSPRHVPDAVYEVDTIPYTLTGKKLEIPVRKLLQGLALDRAASPDAMSDPSAILPFVDFGNRFQDYLSTRKKSDQYEQPIKFIWSK